MSSVYKPIPHKRKHSRDPTLTLSTGKKKRNAGRRDGRKEEKKERKNGKEKEERKMHTKKRESKEQKKVKNAH